MENLLLSFNVIFPIFVMLAIGYGLKHFKLCNTSTIDSMNSISFKIFLPLLLFNNIYKTDVREAFNPKIVVFAVSSIIIIFAVLLLFIPLIEKENKKRGVIVQGILRSNFVIFGLPITTALCGADNLGATSILIAVVVPLYNALCVIALEIFRGKGLSLKRIARGVFTNPLIIAGVLGIIMMLLGWRLPTAIDSSINDISKIATPLALILLGASFSFSDTSACRKQLTLAVLSKLIIIPLVFIPIAILFGFRDFDLIALMVMLGAPTAVSSFTMAAQMDADHTLAGQIVVFTSIGSIFSMFLWIFVLKQLGLF